MEQSRYVALDTYSNWDVSEHDVPQRLGNYTALEAAAARDRCGYNTGPVSLGMDHADALGGVYSAKAYNRACPLLKTLYTNRCANDCYYCINTSRHLKYRASYTPYELARRFIGMVKKGIVTGLFLSSGIGSDEDRVMEDMLNTVEIIRYRYGFRGYIHLKVLPGVGRDYIRRAIGLADRVSINLEVPSRTYIGDVSSTKDYMNDLYGRLKIISESIRKYGGARSGFTTQFIVGAAGESDRDILQCVWDLYDNLGLRRAYFSGFHPIPGTKLEFHRAENRWRELRLYQMDFLSRLYPFERRELEDALGEDGSLPNEDPKTRIARTLITEPLDVNSASYADLVKVPGIGPITARRIVEARMHERIERAKDLARLGVRVKRALPYLKINGWRQAKLLG